MDQPGFAAFTAEDFTGTVGQHLVDVHIGLRAGAGLPDHQRKFIRVLACQYFVGSCNDGLGLFCIQQPQRTVHSGTGFFHLSQRVNDFMRLTLTADLEVVQ